MSIACVSFHSCMGMGSIVVTLTDAAKVAVIGSLMLVVLVLMMVESEEVKAVEVVVFAKSLLRSWVPGLLSVV